MPPQRAQRTQTPNDMAGDMRKQSRYPLRPLCPLWLAVLCPPYLRGEGPRPYFSGNIISATRPMTTPFASLIFCR